MKFLKITVEDLGNDSVNTTIVLNGSVVDVTAYACEAMYKINQQINAAIPERYPRNAFWNCVVERMGERLLEESEK